MLAQTEGERSALLSEGVAAARERQEILFELIAIDPELALRLMVPLDVRRTLPPEIVALLEERISGVGDLKAIAALPTSPPDETFRSVRREARIDGRSFETFTYGRRLAAGSRGGIPLHGIAVGGRFALRDSPIRQLEPGEQPPPGRVIEELCAISGEPSGPENASPDRPVVGVDDGSHVYYLCSAGHIALLEDELLAAENEGSAGAGEAPVMAAMPTHSTGTKRVLFIRVRFADQPSTMSPQSEASALTMFSEAAAFLSENAYGALTIEPTITPVYTLPETANWYLGNDTSGYALNVLQAARAVAANPSSYPNNGGLLAFDYMDYDFEIVRYAGGPGGFTGQAYVSVRGCWLKSSSSGVLAHELGHNLGLWHANFWRPHDAQVPWGDGNNVEYGDLFDTMGNSSAGPWHFNTYEKHRLGWLAPDSTEPVVTSGVYRVYAHDLGGSLDPAKRVALRVPRDDDREYWFEFRQHPGLQDNAWLREGLGVRWDPWLASNGGTQLLDATPSEIDDRLDSTILIGRTYSDPVAHIHVTPLHRNGTSPESLDVAVQVGASPGNRAPTVVLAASALEFAPQTVVSFNVAATDPDGDTLAYFWEFGDRGIGPNAPVVTHAWMADGDYTVRVTVSDTKGGVTIKSTVVRVGTPAGGRVQGRVIDLLGNPVADVRVSTAMSPYDQAYREAFSDSDGVFVLCGVAPDPVSLAATKPGWIFQPATFSNPVDVAGDRAQVDFVGAAIGYRLSGHVRYADGSPVAGAIVSDGSQSEPTDADGNFVFPNTAPGAYTLSATKGSLTFPSVHVEVGFADTVAPTISETTYTLAGEIVDAGAASVVVTDGARATSSYQQNAGGQITTMFTMVGVSAGSWNLRGRAGDVTFMPVEGNPVHVTQDRFDLRLAPASTGSFAISGRVLDRGESVPGAQIIAGGIAATSDSRGGYYLSGLSAGTHAVSVSASGLSFSPASRSVTISGSDVEGVDFVSTRSNGAPWFIEPATASATYLPPFVKLSARANDDDGAAQLRYTWTVLEPLPASVTFSTNNSNSAREVAASFAATGTYRLRVTATDARGASATSDVTLTIQALPVRMTINPPDAPIAVGATHQFTVSCVDQFGSATPPAQPIVWSVNEGGTISNNGVFTPFEPGLARVVTARSGDLVATYVFDVAHTRGPGSGFTQEVWWGIPGLQVDDLTGLPAFPQQPSTVTELNTSLEIAGGMLEGYGQRLRGYFVPPISGDYVFSIASNDASELWLSPAADPAARTRIASVSSGTAFRQWDAESAQRSVPVQLTIDEPVYWEVLHVGNSLDDHVSVGVELPGGMFEGPIPMHRLQPWGSAVFSPPQITLSPRANPAFVGAELSTNLTVAATSEGGEATLTYTWRNDAPSPGPVVFLPNGTNAAKNTVARFARPGRYTLRIAVSDMAGQTTEASVVVTVEETFVSWQRRFFSAVELGNIALADTRWGPAADPDGDGVANLLEYAFDLDPLTPSADGTPAPVFVEVDGVEYLAIRFRRNAAASDLAFTPQVSSDAIHWQPGLIAVGDPTADVVTYRDFDPSAAHTKRFVRVEVTAP